MVPIETYHTDPVPLSIYKTLMGICIVVEVTKEGLLSFRNFFVDMLGPNLPNNRQNNNVQVSTQKRWNPHKCIFSHFL